MFFGRIASVLSIMLAVAPIISTPAQTPTDSTQEIAALRESWVRHWKMHDLEGLGMMYSEDATFLAPIGPLISGRDAIVKYLGQIMDLSNSNITVASDRSGEVSGNLAYDSGLVQYWIKGDNAPVKGFYVVVLKRDSTGEWHIVRQAWNELSASHR